jgi:hypothetical protein
MTAFMSEVYREFRGSRHFPMLIPWPSLGKISP